MIELSGQLLPVQVLEAPVADERDMVLVLTAEGTKYRLSIREFYVVEESMHAMSLLQAQECNMLAKFMLVAASKVDQEIPQEQPTSADCGYRS